MSSVYGTNNEPIIGSLATADSRLRALSYILGCDNQSVCWRLAVSAWLTDFWTSVMASDYVEEVYQICNRIHVEYHYFSYSRATFCSSRASKYLSRFDLAHKNNCLLPFFRKRRLKEGPEDVGLSARNPSLRASCWPWTWPDLQLIGNIDVKI